MHSLVGSCLCPELRLNPQPWLIRRMLQPTELPRWASLFLLKLSIELLSDPAFTRLRFVPREMGGEAHPTAWGRGSQPLCLLQPKPEDAQMSLSGEGQALCVPTVGHCGSAREKKNRLSTGPIPRTNVTGIALRARRQTHRRARAVGSHSFRSGGAKRCL